MKLQSPEFENGGKLPEKIGYMAENTSPELEIQDVPGEAESLALMLLDPDAQEMAGKTWLHWLVWNIPPETRTVEQGTSPGIEGETDFRQSQYNGPNPPDGEHTLVFKLYALDRELELEEGATREQFEKAIEDSVLEVVELSGSYPYEHKLRD